MRFMSFFGPSPLAMVITAILVILIAAVVFVGVNVILAFMGGPGACTPGGAGGITISDANAQAFDQKWDTFNSALVGGSPATVDFNESEISSFVDREIGSPFSDPQACIHDGFGEGTATLDFLGLNAKIKVKGNMDLSGQHPKALIDDIEVGNVPGFITGAIESFVEDAIEEETNKVDLEHPMTPTLTEGSALLDGQP